MSDTYTLPPDDGGANTEIIDGDTLKFRGERWRLVDLDAPELTLRPKGFFTPWDAPGLRKYAHCQYEVELAHVAARRLEQLMSDAVERGALVIQVLKGRDAHKRQLVRVVIDGRSVADTLVAEGCGKYMTGGSDVKPIHCDCADAQVSFEHRMFRKAGQIMESKERRDGAEREAARRLRAGESLL